MESPEPLNRKKKNGAVRAPFRVKYYYPRLTAGILTAFSATTTTATMAAISAASTPIRRTAIFARTGFIDGQSATADFLAAEGSNGGLSAFGRAHRHKAKSAGAAAHAVGNEVDFRDRAVDGEKILKIVFSGVEGKIPDIQFCVHSVMLKTRYRFPELFPDIGFQIITELCSLEDPPCGNMFT